MLAEALSERLPTRDEADSASEAVSALVKGLTSSGSLPIKVSEDGGEVQVELLPALGMLVVDVLTHVAKGEMVTLVPYGAELTTQKAADLLNVSRPFLTKLLENGEMEFHKVGTHRRIPVTELLAYKQRRDQDRSDALSKLQKLGQEYDAG